MKRINTTPITSFFAKKQRNEPAQTQSNSRPFVDIPETTNEETTNSGIPDLETNIEEDSEIEMESNSSSTIEPIIGRLTEFDIASLPKDPGLRRKLTDFHINDRDIIRREYIRRGSCQPRGYKFPKTKRNFVSSWFDKFKPWLEYSIEKDGAYCFVCYLFKSDTSSERETFVSGGFRTWGKPKALDKHVGNHKSAHNNAMKNFDAFNRQKSSIACCFENFTNEVKSDYRIRLEASIQAMRYICLQGLASRGHDESEKSLNRGNFLELVKLLAKCDDNAARVILQNSPGNCILTSHPIHKDIITAFAQETTKKIMEELNGGFFGILADESADMSDKEQMALCIRYVDKMGGVKERFLGIVHVDEMTSVTLKVAIDTLLLEHSLTLSSVRGQGYDGASYILREKQAEHVLKALQMGELISGSGLNQEKGLSRPSDTRWGSHFKTILSVFDLFSTIIDVLDAIGEFCDGIELVKVEKLAYTMQTFDYVFIGLLMIAILGITNTLSLALQKREQNIVNVVALIGVTKRNLQKIRDDGWENHMEKVTSFCLKHEIPVPSMSDKYVVPGRHKRGRTELDNLRHFRVDLFLSLIDQVLHEIDSRFDEHFEYQLGNFYEDVTHDDRFWNLKSLNELSMMLVETKKDLVHSKV
ncbi:uncharacterized protein LOC141631779 [Silene latifolia]|uniref:uncharacterized protein LOC141631779 n=1 Tax=Silene latifolia TaxID=37657 RepID=UPI003D78AA7B